MMTELNRNLSDMQDQVKEMIEMADNDKMDFSHHTRLETRRLSNYVTELLGSMQNEVEHELRR